MRTLLCCVATLVCGSYLHAAGNASDDLPKTVSPEARTYAVRLFGTANQISEDYIRPVAMEELMLAGVAALYEAARVPLPIRVRDEVKKSAAAIDSIKRPADNSAP